MNTGFLFGVAIGPVQTFIDAARRLRDLHQGSRWLSDTAAALAQVLRDQHGATMVFPAPPSDPAAPDGAAPGDTTNKLLCRLPASAEPGRVADALRQALAAQLAAVGQRCLAELKQLNLLTAVDEAEFARQLPGGLQLYCGWAAWSDAGAGAGDAAAVAAYAQAYAGVTQALEARKFTRGFEANGQAPQARQLSSLDGLRESVLADAPRWAAAPGSAGQLAGMGDGSGGNPATVRLRARLGLTPAEHLDALGLVKRTLGRRAAFPAVARVALQPWVERLSPPQRDALTERLARLCEWEHLARRNACHAIDDPMSVLPFDAELLLPGRLAVWRKRGLAHGGDVPADAALAELDRLDAWLHAQDAGGQPLVDWPRQDIPHLALLAADGDRMGRLLTDLAAASGQPGHQRLAQALRAAAAAACDEVRTHGGTPVYAGGDDLLAVLPAERGLACARAVQRSVCVHLHAALPQAMAARATLSIGIAFGHVLTPLGALRQRAQQALQLAKNSHPDDATAGGLRDALCLWVEPRGGAGRACMGRWTATDGETTPAMPARLLLWQQLFADAEVSRALPYDLGQELADELPWAVMPAAQRLFSRRTRQGAAQAGVFAQAVRAVWQFWWPRAPLVQRGRWVAQRLADELYVARWLQAHPKPKALEPQQPEPADA